MKRKVLIIIVILLMSSIAGCSSKDNEKIFGKYEFDKIIWASPASSTRPSKEELAETKYIIKKGRFEIISPENKFKLSNPIYKREEMKDDIIRVFNDKVSNFVSISKYKEKYRYSIYEKENVRKNQYYIYSLDDELWIVLEGREMWYIYKLK